MSEGRRQEVLAVLCDHDARIRQVLRDDLRVVDGTPPGNPLVDIFVTDSRESAAAFVNSLREHKAVFDWQLNVSIEQRIFVLHCAGCMTNEDILVIAGASIESVAQGFFEELMRVNNELVAMQRDLAKRNEQLRTVNQQLEEEARWREIAVAEARRQTLALERSNRDLQQFAYAISHDLQEPLRTIVGYSRLIERRHSDELGPQSREFLGLLIDGANRMQQMIEGVLKLARVESKGGEIVEFDAGAVCDRVIRGLRRKIEEVGGRVTRDELPTIRAREILFMQLLQNLIGNGLKFHSHLPPRVHVSATSRDDFWLFSVRDNGIGIDPRYAEKIFQVFRRLHTIDEYSGTGIGLAICKRIIELHGGHLWVDSSEGQGATFHFTIPITPPSSEPTDEAKSLTEGDTLPSRPPV